jgi:hypothetical protein
MRYLTPRKSRDGLYYANSVCIGSLPSNKLFRLMEHTGIFSQTRQDILMRSAVFLLLLDVR